MSSAWLASLPLAGWPKNAGYVSAILALDDMIATTVVSYRALTCASFMDNVLRQLEPIRNQGILSSPTPGDLHAPACATRDGASAAEPARALRADAARCLRGTLTSRRASNGMAQAITNYDGGQK